MEVFDGSWKDRCCVTPCPAKIVRPFVENNHYLHKWPAIVTLKMALWDGPFIRGVILFGHGPQQISTRYGGLTWELSRLWIQDQVPRNAETWVIAQAIRYIKRSFPHVQHIVSYADPSVGHQGVIYQAANFRHDGMTDQERKSPRFDYVANGKRYGRRGHIPEGVPFTRVPRMPKNRYVYTIHNRHGG